MDEWHDYDQLMDWTDRLRMLAHVQGSYLDVLREQGFDAEQSFVLVRDWSGRVYDWTTRQQMGFPPFAQVPVAGDLVDPSGVTPGEPYLIVTDDPMAETAEANGEAAGVSDEPLVDDQHLDEAA